MFFDIPGQNVSDDVIYTDDVGQRFSNSVGLSLSFVVKHSVTVTICATSAAAYIRHLLQVSAMFHFL